MVRALGGGVINVIMAQPDEKPRTSLRLRGVPDWQTLPTPQLLAPKMENGQSSAHLFHSRRALATLTSPVRLIILKRQF
ncbi:MAG: hypothetical protein R3B47_03350 [Bacteroidia bacterium]